MFLSQNRNQIMENCILATFDTATAFHSKNLIHVAGWKTNKAYKVNKKIILPSLIGIDWHWHYYNRNTRDFIHDIDKVLCYILGKRLEDVVTVYTTIDLRLGEIRRGDSDYMRVIESTFFKIRFFKKGTVHLTFKDLDMWEKFNIRAAKGKMWIGDGE